MVKQESNLINRQKMDLDVIKRFPNHLKYAKVQTYEMCLEAILRKGIVLGDVRWSDLNLSKVQVYNLCIKAVKRQ
ncbi:TPA: hypothetical protein ACMU2O_001524 [Clostridioides difficile]